MVVVNGRWVSLNLRLISRFNLDVINDRFVNSDKSLLQQALQYLGQLVTNPLIEDGAFRSSYVDAEKETVKKQLESVINDKMRYASQRCQEEMFVGEPMSLNALGRLNDLQSITAASLYSRYSQWLSEAKFDLYVVGDTTLEEVTSIVQQSFNMPVNRALPIEYVDINKKVNRVKTIVDQLDVTQGKLNLGLRIPASYGNGNVASALVYNGILGAFPHSKLFMNVREKESLAYYCYSSFDSYKGLLTIQSGIEFANYKKALDIIEEQLKLLREGQISDNELQQTKAMLSNSLRETLDGAYDIINFDYTTSYYNIELTIEQLVSEVEAATIDDIVAIANQVELDTIYFLRNREEVS